MSKDPTNKDDLTSAAPDRPIPTPGLDRKVPNDHTHAPLPDPVPWTPPGDGTVQMDPGQRDFRLYTFNDASGAVIAKVIVPRVLGALSGISCNPGLEYWIDVFPKGPPAGTLTVTWTDYFWSAPPSVTPGNLSFRMNQAPSWTAQTQMPATSAVAFVASNVVLVWNIALNAAGAWSGELVWYNTTGQNNVFNSSAPSGSATLTANVTANARVAWYRTSVAPF